MIQRIVAIKPTLLKKWNKTDNGCIIEFGNFGKSMQIIIITKTQFWKYLMIILLIV